MRVQILNVAGIKRCVLDGVCHRETGTLPIFGWRSHVVGIAAHAETGDLGIDASATALRMFQVFENDCATAVTEYKAVAVFVPGAARFFRRLIARGQRLRLTETAQPTGCGRHLAAAGDDQIGVAVLNRPHAQADRMRRGRAGSDHAEIRALQSILDRQVTGDHVDDRGRHEERRNLARSALEKGVVLRLNGVQATDAGTTNSTAALRVEFTEVELGVRHRLDAGRDAVLHEFIHAPSVFRRQVLFQLEAANLSAEAHWKRGHVEPGDRADTAFAAQDRVPGGNDSAADRRNDTEARDNDTTLAHTLPV